ncbi:MAG: DEAD/DEAH box helicase [Patescibacteria group bacterium]|nr:DEAD/DEAH box helicase [Patescibacteria group bacterium]
MAWDPGLGKSFLSLLYGIQHPEARPIIVVCPAGLKLHWSNQASIHVNMYANILDGIKPDKQLGIGVNHPLIILNYDILHAWVEHLKNLNPQLVILDEAHMISSPKSRRSKVVRFLCKDVPHVLALTGTPLCNRPYDLWHILHILQPRQFPSLFSYAQRFCAPRRAPWGWEFKGASNLDELNQLLFDENTGVVIRLKKEDVLQQLPAKQRNIVPVEISDRKEYHKAVTDFLNWIKLVNPTKAPGARLAEKVTKLGELKRLAANLKLAAVFDWIDSFLAESNEKLILFGWHHQILESLMDRYEKQAVLVHGSVHKKKRKLAEDKFLASPSCRLFIGNVQAAGMGWSALGVSNVAFIELPWRPADVTQGEDRCHGLNRGQQGIHTAIWFLIAVNTIEEKLLQILQNKQRIVTEVLDGGNGETLNVYDLLTEELLKEEKL